MSGALAVSQAGPNQTSKNLVGSRETDGVYVAKYTGQAAILKCTGKGKPALKSMQKNDAGYTDLPQNQSQNALRHILWKSS